MKATLIRTGETVDVYPDRIEKEEKLDDKQSWRQWLWGEFDTKRKFHENELRLPKGWNCVYSYKYYQK